MKLDRFMNCRKCDNDEHPLIKEYIMRFIQPNHNDLIRRFHVYHLPAAMQVGLASKILEWTEKSGPEWTVKRLKALKTDFIRLLSGNQPSSKWIDYQGKYPKGIFGNLFRFGLSPKSTPRRTVRVLNALMVYTSFISKDETETQLSKFYESLAATPLNPKVIDEVFAGIQPLARKLKVRPKKIDTVTTFEPSNVKRVPTSDGGSAPETQWLDTIDIVWNNSLGFDLYSKYPQVRQVLKPVKAIIDRHLAKIPLFVTDYCESDIRVKGFAGKIGHIQEPGLKLRAVANPFRVYQLALSRLGKQLYELLKDSVSWDCTHSQDSGNQWAHEKISAGHTMFAVDLSNATDRFPLDLQLKVLRAVGGTLEEDINLFEELSKANWYSPTHGLVNWSKGQPLGLFPSFASFALTHGLLVASLEMRLKLPIGENFRVLGDDIVISDRTLYDAYREVIAKLEVPVSEDKTLVSDVITEFGGRVISRDSIMTLGKWRTSSDRNFLDLVKNIGPRYMKYLQPRQRKVAEIYTVLPKPVGLGLNPHGLSSLTRWELEDKYREFYQSELELPQYSEFTWPKSLLTSEIGREIYCETFQTGYYNLNGSNRKEGTNIDYVRKPAIPTPVGLRNEEVLSRISYSTGVPIQPSSQFRDLHTYPDVLERVHRTARALRLKQGSTRGDPRGTTVLELWEKRIKRISSIAQQS